VWRLSRFHFGFCIEAVCNVDDVPCIGFKFCEREFEFVVCGNFRWELLAVIWKKYLKANWMSEI